MGRLNITGGRVVRRNRINVFFNGRLRRDFVALSVTRSAGFQPDRARIWVTSAVASDNMKAFSGGLLVVIQEGDDVPLFRGNISGPVAAQGEGINQVVLIAESVTTFLDRLPAGFAYSRGELLYRKTNPVTGDNRGINLADVFRGLYDAAADSNWRAVFALGNLDAVGDSAGAMRVPSLRFTAADFRSALARLLSYTPDVLMSEIHTEDKTYLVFSRFGAAGIGGHVLRGAGDNYGGPEDGAALINYSSTGTVSEVYTRGRGWGAPVRRMVTFATDHATAPLTPAWPDANDYSDLAVADFDEAAVLADPESAIEGSPTYVPGREFIFRRFQLPLELWRVYQAEGSNVLYESGGQSRIPVQVFRSAEVVYYDTETGEMATGAATFQLISGWTITEDGYLLLAEPAVQLTAVSYDSEGKRIETRQKRHVYFTVTVGRSDGERPGYDTGVRGGLPVPRIEDSGLVFEFTAEDVRLDYAGGTLTDYYGLEHNFTRYIYYDPVLDLWVTVPEFSAPELINDDRAFLKHITERALAERRSMRSQAVCEVPYIASGFYVGDSVRILGRGVDNLRFTAVAAVFDLEQWNTTVLVTDQVPPVFVTERNSTYGVPRKGDGGNNQTAAQLAMETAGRGSNADSLAAWYGNTGSRGPNVVRGDSATLAEDSGFFRRGILDPIIRGMNGRG